MTEAAMGTALEFQDRMSRFTAAVCDWAAAQHFRGLGTCDDAAVATRAAALRIEG
jgi:hypothetical protein